MSAANSKQTVEDRTSRARTIRFGVMCNGTVFPEWQARCLEQLLELDGIEPALIIVDEKAAAEGTLAKLKSNPTRNLPFILYSKYLLRPRLYRSRDLSGRFSGVPFMRSRTVRKGKFSEYFTDQDLETIRSHDLDFIMRFAFGILRGDVLKSSRYGVWSFHHDDESRYRGAVPCFWEILAGDDVSAAILQRLTHRLDGGVILRKGHFRTVHYSYRMNVDRVFLNCTHWPAQVCTDILNGNADYVDATPSKTKAPIYRYPTGLDTLRLQAKLAKNLFEETWRFLFRHDHWNVGVVDAPIERFLDPEFEPSPEWLPARGRSLFAADPFGIEHDGRSWIFFEDFDYCLGKGKISCLEAGGPSGSPKPTPVLDLPQHLAYPYVFEHEGRVYLVPETAQARGIRLYEAEQFPERWKEVATLVDGVAAVDTTIFPHEGRWWALYTDEDRDPRANLFAMWADDLFGPWRPHALGPIKSDIRSARPGGTPFVHQGQLYRPAQNCARTYGGSVVIHRVVRLTPDAFEEEEVREVRPLARGPYPDGLHTLSRLGGRTLVDSKRSLFIPCGLRDCLRRSLGKVSRIVRGG